MLINKIQCPEDISSFLSLSGGQAEEILKDTPEYLLDTMAEVLRALLYSIHMPEEETESAVSIIKERRMGRLFENVKMDIQEERRKSAEAIARAEEAEVKIQIYRQIIRLIRNDRKEMEIREILMQKFYLTEEQAETEYRKVLEDWQ